MARIKMSPSILMEIDSQKMMQTINGNDSVFHYTIFRRRHPTPEEAAEQWRKEIKQLKELLLEYQAQIEASIEKQSKDQ